MHLVVEQKDFQELLREIAVLPSFSVATKTALGKYLINSKRYLKTVQSAKPKLKNLYPTRAQNLHGWFSLT